MKDTIIAGLVLGVSVVAAFFLFGIDEKVLFDENGTLEVLQVITLASATVVTVLAAVRLRPAGQFVALTTALICLMFFVRELPSCQPDLDIGCVPRAAHRLVPAVCTALLLLQTVFMFRMSSKALFQILHPFFSWPLAFVAFLLFSSEMFEMIHLSALEESIELIGYIVLLLSGIWMLKSSFHVGLWQAFFQSAGTMLQRLSISNTRRR